MTCSTTINCLAKRQRQKLRRVEVVPEVLEEEINAKLTPLGIVGEPLRLVRDFCVPCYFSCWFALPDSFWFLLFVRKMRPISFRLASAIPPTGYRLNPSKRTMNLLNLLNLPTGYCYISFPVLFPVPTYHR